MELQKLVFKAEEHAAMFSMYNELRKRKAEVVAYSEMASLEELSEEQQQKVEETKAEVEARFQAVVDLLTTKFNCHTVDEAEDKLADLQTKLEAINRVRAELSMLKTQIEVESKLGTLDPNTRQQAEAMLDKHQRTIQVLYEAASAILPASKLVLL